jgi:hypothetical protein
MSLAVSDWFARWSRLSIEFGLSQAVGQSAGLIAGLIYVRLMPVDQYALYAMGLTSLRSSRPVATLGSRARSTIFGARAAKIDAVLNQ